MPWWLAGLSMVVTTFSNDTPNLVARRMLASKSEKDALMSVLFFDFAHNVLRAWPWILVALCSLIVYPELADIQRALPNLDPSLLGHDGPGWEAIHREAGALERTGDGESIPRALLGWVAGVAAIWSGLSFAVFFLTEQP